MIEVQMVEVSKLHESKTNPRSVFDKAELAELTNSIREKGVLSPLFVRNWPTSQDHEIISGARRYRAAKSAGLKEVPCIIRVLSDEEALEIQLSENLQRADIHALDEGAGFQRLQKDYGYNIEQIATKVAKEPWYVQRCLKYMDLIEPIKKLFWAREISASHALLVARLQPDQQKECVSCDTKDAKLVPKAGSCIACPKRTGANKLLFPDIKDADTCTDSACYESKVRTFIKVQVGTHKDAILLATGDKHNVSKESKATYEWTIAGDKTCPDTKQGIVIENLMHWIPEKQKSRLGQVLMVCTNEKCKTHNPDPAKDYRILLDWMIRSLSSDNARAVCSAMEWELKKGKYADKDYHGTIAERLSKLTASGCAQWMYLLMLADVDLWFFNNTTVSKPVLLEARAKLEDVPLAEIAKLAKQKPSKKAEAPKEKKRAASA